MLHDECICTNEFVQHSDLDNRSVLWSTVFLHLRLLQTAIFRNAALKTER